MFDLVIYTRDRHPPKHCSFSEQGGSWPPHCVDGTPGFAFHPRLPVLDDAVVIDKGVREDRDAYSGFDGTDLESILREKEIRRCYVAGLATDYCVKATVLDAIKAGFETWALIDAVAAVDVNPGDGTRALLEMRHAGAQLAESGQALTILRNHPAPTALLIVDVQNDFCEGGALAVPGASRILGTLEKVLLLERDQG